MYPLDPQEKGIRFGYGLIFGIVVAISLSALSPASAQTMYKYVAADGKVVYGDRPPADGKVLKTLTPDSTPSSALPVSAEEQLRRLKALRPAAPAASGVVLYSAAWCGYCTKAKAYLGAKGIAYREIDIDTPDGLASFAQAGGGKGVPLLLAGDQRVQGFSPGAYDQLFANRKTQSGKGER
jgi:glutaredoxin